MSKNIYTVKLINVEGCKFDEVEGITNLKSAKEWAKDRGQNYKVIIQKNPNYQGMDGYAEKTYEYNIK